MKHFILVLLLPFAVHAQAPAKSTWEKAKETATEVGQDIKEGTEKAAEKVEQTLSEARENRGSRGFVITGNYSYVDLIIPSKYGVTVGYVKDASDTFELDYMRGSISTGWLGVDIGSITEQRLALLWRSYNQRNTFNFQMGVHYNQFRVHIGDELLRRVTGNPAVDITVMEFQTLGVSWGLGNRWTTKGGFVWGFDWLQLHIPVTTLKEKTPYTEYATNQEDKDDAETASKIIRNFPRIVALKIQLGASF